MRTQAKSPLFRGASIVAAALLLFPGALGTAHAADAGERGWTTFIRSGASWTPATEDGAATPVKQGDVVGFRFAAAPPGTPRPPRDAAATFEKLCAKQKTDPGQVAVGYLIDYGRPADSASGQEKVMAPRAGCTVVQEGTTARDMLKGVADVRLDPDKGGICGVDSYPLEGCQEKVADLKGAAAPDDKATASVAEAGAVAVPASNITAEQETTSTAAKPAQGTDTGPGNGWLLAVAALLLSALAAVAVLFYRRRARSETGHRVVGSGASPVAGTRTARRGGERTAGPDDEDTGSTSTRPERPTS